MIAECDHRPSMDPRREGICAKCARPIPPDEIPPKRDHLYERAIFDRLIEDVGRRTGEDVSSLIHRVERRIEQGAATYGDLAFLESSRDNLLELEDEAADSIAYALFQMQVVNARATDADGVHHCLFESMAHAAITAIYARRARFLLSEIGL